MLIGAFGLFEWELINGAIVDQARTVAVNVFGIVEMFYLYECRSLTHSVLKIGLLSNPWAVGGTTLMMALQLAYTHVPMMNRFFQSAPIDLYAWLRIFAVSIAAYIIVVLRNGFEEASMKTQQGNSRDVTSGHLLAGRKCHVKSTGGRHRRS
jgi:Ca2+-transporting ATPase